MRDIRRRVSHIGGERQGEAAAACGVVNERDDRLRTEAHGAHDAGIELLHGHLALSSARPLLGEGVRPKVGAGAEKSTLAAQDDDSHVEAGLESVKIGRDLARHLG